MSATILVYDYTNYRDFLRDRFAGLKQRNPLFSYRSFNRLAGLKSSGFLKLVIDGERNLAEEGIRKIARGFRLSEREAKFFSALVRFNQAKDDDQRGYYARELKAERALAEMPLGEDPLAPAAVEERQQVVEHRIDGG